MIGSKGKLRPDDGDGGLRVVVDDSRGRIGWDGGDVDCEKNSRYTARYDVWIVNEQGELLNENADLLQSL